MHTVYSTSKNTTVTIAVAVINHAAIVIVEVVVVVFIVIVTHVSQRIILLILSKRVSYYRKDLTYDEAIELGKRAIMHATHRDAMSGGINNGANSRILIHIHP